MSKSGENSCDCQYSNIIFLVVNFLLYDFFVVFAMLGMLSPASRGALTTAAITFYMIHGAVAGYFSARIYKTMKGREWKKAAFLTAALYPAVVGATCFVLNFFIWGKV